MKKLVLSLLVCVFVLSGLSGCKKAFNEALSILGIGGGEDNSGRTANAVKLDKETRYYNDFLGVSYAIPNNWWLYEVNEENFSEKKGDITDDISMDIMYGEYDIYSYANLWLISFGNLKDDRQDNHLGFDLDVRSIEGAPDMAAYMKYFEAYMLEPEDETSYRMTDSQQLTINDTVFELRDYLVDRDQDDYHILTLSCKIKEGYFLNLLIDYWPQNTKARQAIISSISEGLQLY
ncbi:MAG: hypothetical protein LBK77_00400 [Spirochaetaceae bacterium]|jgi:hypothetical protein|nr:hypothetical protein [Spirochaetaceae bacterium]